MYPDPWLVPNKTILADTIGISRSFLWERLTVANNAPAEDGPYDIALWYAAALAAGAPVIDPVECFPDSPQITPEPSGLSVPLLLGQLHLRSEPFGDILASPNDHDHEAIRMAGDALAELEAWYFRAIVAAFPADQRRQMPAPVLKDLAEWVGAERLGLGAL